MAPRPAAGGVGDGQLPVLDLQRFADGERTEPATPRRREQARQRGQVARSADLSLALAVLAAALILPRALPLAVSDVVDLAVRLWSGQEWSGELTPAQLWRLGRQALAALRGSALVVAVVAAVVLASQLVQVGFLLSGQALVPRWHRIDPLATLQRWFSWRSAVELAKGLAKAAAVAWAAWGAVAAVAQQAPRLSAMEPLEAAAWLGSVAVQAVGRMGLMLLVVGAADYAFQRWDFEQGLRMTRQEVLEEYRQVEGDPHVRARIRQRMRQLASRRMLQQVPRASVVVTNPTHVAVALAYEMERMAAPVVVAKGQDHMARRIVEVAVEHGVAVVENPPLAWALFESVEVGQPIPPELYRAVAEVLAYVYRARTRPRRPAGAGASRAGAAATGGGVRG
ncbi:MAG TPA: EscU/YscU/HrcU family type III secretion system export apparatus switch protein [Limnochordales bacterium]